jgi:hypothetical protein
MTVGTQQPQMGLTFDHVWAMFQETDKKFQTMSQEADKRQQETERGMKESRAEHDRMVAETERLMKENAAQQEKTNLLMKELTKNVGGVNKSFGRLMEEMYSARLWDKFEAFGYDFTSSCRNKKFRENKQTLAEADIFLENGLYAMVVEVKADLTTEDVDDHLERIATIRGYMDRHGDKRFLVGAVAGGIAPENVVRYA